MIKDNGLTYAIGKVCMKKLENAGWKHEATVMRDQGDKAKEYGMLYTKAGNKFWLNKDTYLNLPS